jgi:hypothetical protein
MGLFYLGYGELINPEHPLSHVFHPLAIVDYEHKLVAKYKGVIRLSAKCNIVV